jgi:hypothetical protein
MVSAWENNVDLIQIWVKNPEDHGIILVNFVNWDQCMTTLKKISYYLMMFFFPDILLL